MMSIFHDKICIPSKTIAGILKYIDKICHKETNLQFLTYNLRSHFNTVIDNLTRNRTNIDESIPIFFSIHSSFTVESSNGKCSINI